MDLKWVRPKGWAHFFVTVRRSGGDKDLDRQRSAILGLWVMWEQKIRKGIRYFPMPRSYRLELIKQLMDREFKKEIQELRGEKCTSR